MKRLPRPLEILVFYTRLFCMLIWLMIASAIAMPLAIFRWKNAENNYEFGQIYGPVSRWIMGIRIVLEGAEHLKHRPAIFALNHQSGLDMTTLSYPYPKGAVIIGKKEIRRIPFFGLMFEAFGNVLIDRKDRRDSLSGLNTVVERMKKENFSAWIFPEGTRHPTGDGLLPFKKGAFYMGVQAQVPIVPIVCSRLSRLVSFHDKFARSGTIVIRVLPPVITQGLGMPDVERILNETHSKMLAAQREVSIQAEALDSH